MPTTQRMLVAYGVAQLTVGLQLGVAVAVSVLVFEIPFPLALALIPAGLPLVALQAVLAHRVLARRAASS